MPAVTPRALVLLFAAGCGSPDPGGSECESAWGPPDDTCWSCARPDLELDDYVRSTGAGTPWGTCGSPAAEVVTYEVSRCTDADGLAGALVRSASETIDAWSEETVLFDAAGAAVWQRWCDGCVSCGTELGCGGTVRDGWPCRGRGAYVEVTCEGAYSPGDFGLSPPACSW